MGLPEVFDQVNPHGFFSTGKPSSQGVSKEGMA